MIQKRNKERQTVYMQKKYKGIGNVILNILEDNEWHTTDQLVDECRKCGIDLEGAREPVYNAVFRLKNKGLIENGGAGRFRKKTCNNEKTAEEKSAESDVENEMDFMSALEVVKREIENCRKIKWMQCSENELKKARETVRQLAELSDEIQQTIES